MATVEKMTLEELQRFIDARIEARLISLFGSFEINSDETFLGESDTRTWEQVKQDIERTRWTPPPGAKSWLELLREDRDN